MDRIEDQSNLDEVEVNDISTSRMEVTPDISEELIVVCNMEDLEETSMEDQVSRPQTFEDDHFFVTVQELDLDNLQNEDFSKNDQKSDESSNSRQLMEVEILFDPQKVIQLLVEEDEPLKMEENKKMFGFDEDVSEEEEEEAVENEDVHYKHSCKRTYMFNPRFPHLSFTYLSYWVALPRTSLLDLWLILKLQIINQSPTPRLDFPACIS